jgi:two-component system cell cycle response regulator DivK
MPASILIIDDYADNREILRLMLEMDGYLIREARNGVEGLEMARAAKPNVALIDLSMPGLDGWEVIKELRADERTRSIPCVAVSAFADGTRERALAQGFDAYLTKPFRKKELIEVVARLLAEDHAPQQQIEDSRQEEAV